MADHGNQIAMFTVGAGDLRVIPGKPDLGHEVYYRRNSANYLHVRFPTAKCRQQLPGSAVKSHITGKSDHNLLIFRMIPYIIRDHIAAVFIYHCLSRLPNGICHPLCANNQIRAFRRFFSLNSKSFLASHADSKQSNMRLHGKSEILCQHMPALCHRKSLFLQRTSNNYRNSSAGKGRINFLLKASCFSGILCNQIFAVKLAQHGSI